MNVESHISHSANRIWLCGYFVLSVIFGALVFSGLFADTDLSTAMRLIFLATLVLNMKRWLGAVLFAICQAHLFYLEPGLAEPMADLNSWIWVGLSFCLLVSLSRFRRLQEYEDVPAYRILYTWIVEKRPPKTATAEIQRLLNQMFRTGALLLVCALAAWAILGLFPTRSTLTGLNTVREYRIRPEGYRALVVGISLFGAFLAVYAVMNDLIWRKSSHGQLRVYLNGIMVRLLHRDFGLVVKRKLKLRRRLSKKRTAPSIEEIQPES